MTLEEGSEAKALAEEEEEEEEVGCFGQSFKLWDVAKRRPA